MYTRQEASRLRQEFWTAFGHYMAPLPSAEGLKINWINYKTGLPNVSFKMDAGTADAQIAIVLSHTDSDIRQLYFEQFMQIKHLLHDELGEEWQWEVSSKDEYDRPVSTKLYVATASAPPQGGCYSQLSATAGLLQPAFHHRGGRYGQHSTTAEALQAQWGCGNHN